MMKRETHRIPRFLAIILALLLALNQFLFAQSTFSGERLEKACLDYAYSVAGQDAEISLAAKINDLIFEETGVTARCAGNAGSLRGLCRMAVEFRHGGRLLKRLDIPMRIKIYGEVIVAAKALRDGEEIDNGMLKTVKRDITQYREGDLPTYGELAGSVVKQSVPKGGIITREMLKKQTIIKRGDMVTLVVQSGAVTIRTKGFALDDASSGDRVKIKRDGSILTGIAAIDGSVILRSN